MDSASAAFDARWHPGRPVPVRGTAGTLFQRSHIIRGPGNKMPDAHIRASFMRRGTQGLGYDPDERAADEYAHHESTERHPIHFVREGSAAASQFWGTGSCEPGRSIERLPDTEQSCGLAAGSSWNYIPHVVQPSSSRLQRGASCIDRCPGRRLRPQGGAEPLHRAQRPDPSTLDFAWQRACCAVSCM